MPPTFLSLVAKAVWYIFQSLTEGLFANLNFPIKFLSYTALQKSDICMSTINEVDEPSRYLNFDTGN